MSSPQQNRIAQIEEMLKENPKDAFLQHALALEKMKLGDYNKAIQLFTNVLENDENYIGSYYHLANAYQSIGEKQKALKTYDKGMQIAETQKEKKAFQELLEAKNLLLET